ncbi:MAG: hypothetical protein GKR89_33800 [Candidatus Latescibacteria bacterium]|nr:hypothetical protein [Candidatus Latescibacterota bacterium]
MYDRYEEAQSSLRAQELYDETRRYDTRGVVFGVLGMGTLAYSIHVLRSQPAEELPLPRRAEPMQLKGVEVGVEADVLRRKMGLVLSRRW